MNCKNCGNKIDGNFCANCGQNKKVDKLNVPNFLTEISDSVFQLNRGLLYSIKELIIRPGHTTREFILGKRKEHFKPIAFVLVMSTIYFFISKISDYPTLIDNFISGWSAAGEEGGLSTNSLTILNWLSDNYAYTTLLLIPLFSIASYISFLGLGRNYLEHIVINSYVTGLQAIFYSFFMVVGVTIDNEDLTVMFALIISILYCYWSYSQFYNNTKKIKIVLRLLLTYILYVFISGLVLFLLSRAI